MTRRELILGAVDDLVESLIGYDRKNDEDLPPGSIENAVTAGEIDVDDMVRRFRMRLNEELETS